jgi:hypothetical protein
VSAESDDNTIYTLRSGPPVSSDRRVRAGECFLQKRRKKTFYTYRSGDDVEEFLLLMRFRDAAKGKGVPRRDEA